MSLAVQNAWLVFLWPDLFSELEENLSGFPIVNLECVDQIIK